MKYVIRFKSYFLFMLLLFTIVISLSSSSKSDMLNPNITTEFIGEREIFDELIGRFNKSNTMQLMVTSISVKKKRNKEQAFSSYGTSKLIKERDYLRSDLSGIKTDFSDRDKFNGTNTIEHVYLSFSNNRFKIKVRLQTWGNETVELSDVKLVKGRQGYFATGNYYNATRTYHYTIALYEEAPTGIGEILSSGK